MNDIEKYTDKIFENIKHMDEEGNEYWFARELMEVLEYKEWTAMKSENIVLFFRAKIWYNYTNNRS